MLQIIVQMFMKFIHILKGRSPICKIKYKLTSLVNKQIGIGNSHFRLEVVLIDFSKVYQPPAKKLVILP